MTNLKVIAAAVALMLSAGVGLAQTSAPAADATKTQNNILPKVNGVAPDDGTPAANTTTGTTDAAAPCINTGETDAAKDQDACRKANEQSDAASKTVAPAN
jgi:hypothetical protein